MKIPNQILLHGLRGYGLRTRTTPRFFSNPPKGQLAGPIMATTRPPAQPSRTNQSTERRQPVFVLGVQTGAATQIKRRRAGGGVIYFSTPDNVYGCRCASGISLA